MVASLLVAAVLLGGFVARQVGHADRLLPLRLVTEGIGTGVAGPVTLNTALRGVLRVDSGAAGAATSAAGQLGSSVGAALFNTIAATVTAGYLAAHPSVSAVAATVHGFNVAMVWGVVVLVVVAVPILLFVSAPVPAAKPDELQRKHRSHNEDDTYNEYLAYYVHVA